MKSDFPFLVYRSAEEDVSVDALIKDESIWLNQKGMAELFGCSTDNISLHLKNIFSEGELERDAVTEKISATAADGKNYLTQFYNLDAIISVGYRVNSRRATQFRIWATGVLKEYMIKGFAMDDERLKQGKTAFGTDYFRELLERVRSIRASERRIWQQITDIFAECSIDYDKNSPTTHNFYAMIQNKFHYAIAGETAAEIIYHRADRTNSPCGRPGGLATPRIMKVLFLKSDRIGVLLFGDLFPLSNLLCSDTVRTPDCRPRARTGKWAALVFAMCLHFTGRIVGFRRCYGCSLQQGLGD